MLRLINAIAPIVSIHARAQRATFHQHRGIRGSIVSIHARAQRATCIYSMDVTAVHCFNPRPRAAGDAKFPPAAVTVNVSIHARAQRATMIARPDPLKPLVSIHARAQRATR